jgi:hypothetical protein
MAQYQAKALRLSVKDQRRLTALTELRIVIREMGEAQRMMDSLALSARSHGATWQEIGDVLGITLQAAAIRYGGSPSQKKHRAGKNYTEGVQTALNV